MRPFATAYLRGELSPALMRWSEGREELEPF